MHLPPDTTLGCIMHQTGIYIQSVYLSAFTVTYIGVENLQLTSLLIVLIINYICSDNWYIRMYDGGHVSASPQLRTALAFIMLSIAARLQSSSGYLLAATYVGRLCVSGAALHLLFARHTATAIPKIIFYTSHLYSVNSHQEGRLLFVAYSVANKAQLG